MTIVIDLPEFAASVDAEVLCDEPMHVHTTFKIGGPARYYLTPCGEDSLRALLNYCRENGISTTVLGNGSDLLVADNGIDGAVISTAAFNGITVEGENILCGAGMPLSKVCVAAEREGLSGLEFAYGIPGSVGGAVYMNAGAYGGEMKDVVAETRHVSAEGCGGFNASQLGFGYRRSSYTDGSLVITQAIFHLVRGDKLKIRAKMDELFARRKNRQPLEYPSAGSVFKRPQGHFAGALIESCGLKGRRIGGAQVSEKHAGFIVNTGGATCSDVRDLIELIKREVLSKTGVVLECEIKFIG